MLSSLVIKNLAGEIAQIMLSEWLEINLMSYECYESYKSSIWISEQRFSNHMHLHLQALKFDFACFEEHIKVKLSIIISYTTICILPWNGNYGAWFCISIHVLYTYMCTVYSHMYNIFC